MTHIQAKGRWRGLDFQLDTNTGRVSGRDADIIEATLSEHDGVALFPQQQAFPAPAPRTNLNDMALLLSSMGYELGGDLAGYTPPAIDENTAGAVS